MSPSINVNGKIVDAEQFKNDWALALMSQGVIVRLTVSRWRATSKLTPECLGLKFADENGHAFMNKYISLGQQKLLQPEVLSEIVHLESLARSVLQDFSFDTVWGKFVPFKVFKEWEEQNQKVRDDYMSQARVMGEKYHEIVAAVKEEYKTMAKDVWYRLYPDKGEPTLAFIEDFTSKIVSKIPSQLDLVDSFRYDFTYFIIPMPSFVQNNIAEAERIKTQASMEKFNSELEKETKQKISEEYIKRKKELIDNFLESTVYHLRSYVSELCDAVLQSMKQQIETDQVSFMQIKRLKVMMKKVKLLNFYDDAEITTLLNGLNLEIEKMKGETDKNTIMRKLAEIVEVSKTEYLPSDTNSAISFLDI